MGTSLSTLHLYGIAEETLRKQLAQGDLLRLQNVPWLSVVPEYGEQDWENGRLEKLAKSMTKSDADAAALLFFWFDDDMFLCRFFRGGKKTAECRSDGSWAKLGKELGLLFGEDSPAKALRYASRCAGLEEQLRLLEETLGTALWDIQEAEARTVLRGDGTLKAIKAREAALRKRPQRFKLTELEREEWPAAIRANQELFELLGPRWEDYFMLSRLQGDHKGTVYTVPGRDHLVGFAASDKAHQNWIVRYDSRDRQLQKLGPLSSAPIRPLWLTKEGELVFLFYDILREQISGSSWSRSSGGGSVACIGADGGIKWSFSPQLERNCTLWYAHSSTDGIITLYVPQGRNNEARVWRIDGETGELLCARSFPPSEKLQHLERADAVSGFVYASRETKEMVVLGEDLEEKTRWDGYPGCDFFGLEGFVGEELWSKGDMQEPLRFWELHTGRKREIRLEIPAYVLAVLPDGRILGVNERQNTLTVFDRRGIVSARCTVPGMLIRAVQEPGRVCLVEHREENPFGDETQHVWRLDPV